MAKVLSRLDILLFANTAQYRREMRDTQRETGSLFNAIKKDAKDMAKVGGAALAGMAAAGATAIASLVKEQVALGTEMTRLSKIANTGVEDMQKLVVAAKAVGVEQDKLGDIYKDTQDKVGDFLSTGGGEMADFFENIAPQVGVTAEQFRKLSGPDALQLYYDSVQKANLSMSEQVFYMESIADEASLLIPLLKDGGKGFDLWAAAAENAGAVMDEKTIRATQELNTSTELLMLSYDGAKKQFTQALLPVLSDVAGALVGTGDASDLARVAGEKLVVGVKFLAKAGNGLIAVFRTVGTVVGATVATVSTLLNGVSMWDNPIIMALKIAKNGKQAAGIVSDASFDIKNMWQGVADRNAYIDALGTGGTNATVRALTEQRILQEQINSQLGQTGQQRQAIAKAEEEAAKATRRHAAAVKELGSAYVSNNELKGLKLKSQEAIAGGKVRGYTAEFAHVTQSLIGSNLKYFSAFNDHYHQGTNSRHATGQAFDVVLKDARQAQKAVAMLEDAARRYGYSVKILDEYANPSKRATGGHLHVSVYGQNAAKNGGADIAYIKQQNSQAVRLAEQLAAEQARIEEQRAQQRAAIRYEYADKITQIETDLTNKIALIRASGFSEKDEAIFIKDAKERAAIEVEQYKSAQKQKLAAFSNFAKSEKELILQNASYRIAAVQADIELTKSQQVQAIGFIKQQIAYELRQAELVHDQQMQQANAYQQTAAERIKNQYELERRQIQLTVAMDEELRQAKIDNLNYAEQAALEELRYAHEKELQSLVSYGKSELQQLRIQFAQQRQAIDRRTDINPAQKSDLRNALMGSEIHAVNQYKKGVQGQYAAQTAELNGTSQNYQLAQQYQQRLDVIQKALDAEVIAVEQAEQAKYQARYKFENQATQLTLSASQATAGHLAGAFKTMLGEQNAAYRVMFASQQAFVMASAGLNMYDAWGDAMAEGATLSTKLASAAVIAAEFGKIISAASQMKLELPGFATGGFTGRGGKYEVAGLVHREEFVSNAATTRKYRPELEAMHNGTYERKKDTPPVSISVSVTVNSDGTPSVESQSKIGSDLGYALAAVAQKEITKALSPGGQIYKIMR